ncbi:hypothetical protein KSZ_34580 [Dictyobacter formicarum]|uniref:Uncharacterized protein n=1 Tax=Dictyobacter formicarum TaxID=2778368 RepID=A0ABQ3VGZ2_9CHLR|nr:hypothetical protein KSZ_34580 [Dictyobacter formicarum]
MVPHRLVDAVQDMVVYIQVAGYLLDNMLSAPASEIHVMVVWGHWVVPVCLKTVMVPKHAPCIAVPYNSQAHLQTGLTSTAMAVRHPVARMRWLLERAFFV